MALLVGHGHQQAAANARLQIFSREPVGRSIQGRCEGGIESRHQWGNRQGVGRHAKPLDQGGGIADRALRAVGRWQQQGLHLLGSQGGGSNHGHQG